MLATVLLLIAMQASPSSGPRRMPTDKSKTNYLENLLHQYLASPRQDPDELRKELHRMKRHMIRPEIPPARPPSPRLKKST